jgi:hypothetical protein
MRALAMIMLLVLGMSSYAQESELINEYKVDFAIGRSTSMVGAMDVAMKADWITGRKRVFDTFVGFVVETSNMGQFVIMLPGEDKEMYMVIYKEDDTKIVCTYKSLIQVEDSSNIKGTNQFKLTFSSRDHYYGIIISIPK